MNYRKLKLSELQKLFSHEFGEKALMYSITRGWRKIEYAESLDELNEAYEYWNESDGKFKEEVREKWLKKNKYMLDKTEKMNII